MSVATKNPFAILDADDAARFDTPAPSKETPPVPAAPARGSQKPRGGPAARGGKYYARGGGNKPPARETNQQNGADDQVNDNQRKYDGRGRGRGSRSGGEGGRGNREGGGGGGYGGGGGGGGGGRGGRRPFDRHSQTGKTDSEKKIHQSWGGDDGKTELKTEQAANIDAAAEGANNDWAGDAAPASNWGAPDATSGDAWGAPAPADGGAPDGEKAEGRPRREREPEEEDNTLTLDQYLAQQREKELAGVPKLESVRKANEGAGADIWKDVVPLQKNEEEDAYFVGKGKSAPKARAKKEEKVFLEIDARFERPDRGGRGRGRGGSDRGASGRGRGRGGGGRGGRPTDSSLNVDDQTAFPSLS